MNGHRGIPDQQNLVGEKTVQIGVLLVAMLAVSAGCNVIPRPAVAPAFDVYISLRRALASEEGPALEVTVKNLTSSNVEISGGWDLKVLSAGRWMTYPPTIVVTGSIPDPNVTLGPGESITGALQVASYFMKVFPGPNQVKLRVTMRLVHGAPFSTDLEQSFVPTPAMARAVNKTAHHRMGAVSHGGSVETARAAELYATIQRKSIGPAALGAAIAKLGPPRDDPPRFWSQIANDNDYPNFHRRRAVFQLFRRHVRVGMRLSELVGLLDHPTWLKPDDIYVVHFGTGYMPVAFKPPDMVFDLSVIAEPNEDVGQVFLRLHGKVDEQACKSYILGNPLVDAGKETIAEIGFGEVFLR